ncbi:MAG TPA: hypothetical protein VFL93_07140 [Longimicrobiaceae bacterium]|nr:hypothetical protein [Longimicrobiaceae bacterium]
MALNGWDTSTTEAPKFSEGRTVSARLQQRNNVAAYTIELTGTLTVAGATGAVAVRGDAVGKIFEQLTTKAGGLNVQDWIGVQLLDAELYFEQAPLPQVLPANGGNGATDIKVRIRLPQYEPRVFAMFEKLLPTTVLPDLLLAIKWGKLSDIFADGFDGTATLTNSDVRIYEETLEGVAGNVARFLPLIYSYRADVVTTKAGMVIQLDSVPAGAEISRVLIRAEAGGAAGYGYEPSDSILGDIKFRVNGSDVVNTIPFDVLQASDVREYGLSALRAGSTTLDAVRDQRSEANSPEPQQWQVLGPGHPQIIADVTKQAGDCRILVTVFARKRA